MRRSVIIGWQHDILVWTQHDVALKGISKYEKGIMYGWVRCGGPVCLSTAVFHWFVPLFAYGCCAGASVEEVDEWDALRGLVFGQNYYKTYIKSHILVYNFVQPSICKPSIELQRVCLLLLVVFGEEHSFFYFLL